MGLSNELSFEAGRFSHHRNPHRFFQSEVLRLYFPALEPYIAWSVLLPSYSSWLISIKCGTACCGPLLPRQESSLPWLPICAIPTSVNEYSFFNSLVVRLPHSSIFWWLVFAFKSVVVLLLVVQGSTMYLPTPHLGQEVVEFFLSSPEDMFIDLKETETSMVDSCMCSDRDQIPNLLVYKMMLQLTEPPDQGFQNVLYWILVESSNRF